VRAVEHARELAPVITELRTRGLTINQIAEAMNERNIETVRGKRWHPATVYRLMRRVAHIEHREAIRR
jgi:DNA-binding transcriptional MerR regulator